MWRNSLIGVALFVMGAMMGSFACCQAWRLHERGRSRKLPTRSVCMKCGKKLAWWMNLPVVSFAVLGGKCRYCGERIGKAEILSELLLGLGFVGAFAGVVGFGAEFGAVEWWKWARLLALLVTLTLMTVLAVYDGKWGEMPTFLLLAAVVGAGLAMAFDMTGRISAGADMRAEVFSAVAAVGILAGTYLILYKVSRGKLVGSGDWVLGLAIALMLADWWLALITIALANFLALGFGVAVYGKKIQGKTIYFGPFFVVASGVVISLAELLWRVWQI